MNIFQPLDVAVVRHNFHVSENLNYITSRFNPLNPPDASKHHFASLKYDFIF